MAKLACVAKLADAHLPVPIRSTRDAQSAQLGAIAAAAALLVSDDGSSMTGTELIVAGGLSPAYLSMSFPRVPRTRLGTPSEHASPLT